MTPIPGKLIIYRLGSLGDTVVALPCFHLIERAFPDAERIVLTNVPVSAKAAPLEMILRDGGFISRSIAYPYMLRDGRALGRLARTLRAERTDTLVYLIGPSRSQAGVSRDVAYFRLCGFRRIIGASLANGSRRVRFTADGAQERESHYLARILTPLGTIDLDDRRWWDLRLTAHEHEKARIALGSLWGQTFIAVNMGGKARQKDWGASNWKALLTMLSGRYEGCGLVFLGASDDSARAQEVMSSWAAGPRLDLCGSLDPRSSGAALQQARLFIGHDSGPFHLADAVGTAAVGIFGDYNRPKQWHPSGISTQVIHSMRGMGAIRPDCVFESAVSLLANSAGEPPERG